MKPTPPPYRSLTPINDKRPDRDDKPTMFAVLVMICVLILCACIGISIWETTPHPAQMPVGVQK